MLIDELDVTDEVLAAATTVTGRGPGDDASSESRMSHKPVTAQSNGGGGGRAGVGGDDEAVGDKDDKDGVFDKIGDWIMGAAEDVGEVIETVAEAVVETAGNVAGAVLGGVVDAASAVAGVASDVAEGAFHLAETAWNSTIGPVVDDLLQGLEDIGAFDLLDTLSLGAIAISFDGGDLHVDLGIGGVAHLGFDVGEDGVFVDAEVIGAGAFEVGVGSDGSLSLGVGAVFGPLGNFGLDAAVDGEGDISIGAEGEIHIPVPTGGTVDVSGSASLEQHGDGYSAAAEYTGGYTTVGGQFVGSGAHASTENDGDGHSTTTIGTHQVAGQRGVAEIRTEQNVIIYSDDGEITGTEGELVISGETLVGDFEESTTVWDRGDTSHEDDKDKDEDDDKEEEDDEGSGGKGGKGGRGDNGDDLDHDDVVAPRRSHDLTLGTQSTAGLAAEVAVGIADAPDSDTAADSVGHHPHAGNDDGPTPGGASADADRPTSDRPTSDQPTSDRPTSGRPDDTGDDEIADDPTAPRGSRVSPQPAPVAVVETPADARPRTGDRPGSGDDTADAPTETSPRHGGPAQTGQPMSAAPAELVEAPEPFADVPAPSVDTDSWTNHTADDTSTTPELDDMEDSL